MIAFLQARWVYYPLIIRHELYIYVCQLNSSCESVNFGLNPTGCMRAVYEMTCKMPKFVLLTVAS